MPGFRIGDIVTRKSYGGDISFTIVGIRNNERSEPIYVLKGILYRIEADSAAGDLELKDPKVANTDLQRFISGIKKQAFRTKTCRGSIFGKFRSTPGSILHIDSSQDFMETCVKHYRESGIKVYGKRSDESDQPSVIMRLLQQYRPDILVVTGHDAMKKDAKPLSIDSYRNSKYYIESVKEARKYQPDPDKLCIFAGACQSYYEAIMEAGANFASSPGRVLINALDPAFVSEKIALTDTKTILTPRDIIPLTISGSKGIGGINTRGRLKK